MSNVLCVLNYKSRGGQVRRRLPELEAEMNRLGLTYQMLDLVQPDHFTRLREAVLATPGPDVVMGIGGDGTHHSVVNNMMQIKSDQPELQLPSYAVCPFGTGNDIAKSLGIRVGRRHYAEVIETAAAGAIRPFDLGFVGGTYFLDMVSLGLDAKVLEYRDRFVTALLKKPGLNRFLHGYLIYGYAAVRAMVRYPNWDCEVEVDGKSHFKGKAAGILVNNCPVHAGEFELTPGSRPDDGKLDLIVIPGQLSYIWRFLRCYRFNPNFLRPNPNHPLQAKAERIVIRGRNPIPMQVDGEYRESVTELELTVKPGAIRMRVPPSGPAYERQ
jgi:diacylglycerol kinase (ATP)